MPASNTSTQNPSTTSSTARALIIAINDYSVARTLGFKDYGDLNHAIKSGDEFISVLEKQKGYIYRDYGSNYFRLNDSDATLANVVLGIMALAKASKKGDVVTITISSHGTSKTRADQTSSKSMFNFSLLYDYDLDEFELFLLLRLFEKGVRVHVCFDMCYSRSWVDFNNLDYIDTVKTISNLAAKLEDRGSDQLARLLLDNYLTNVDSLEIQASVCLIGGVSDLLSMNDFYNSAHIMLRTLNIANVKETTAVQLLSMISQQILDDIDDGYASELWPYWYVEYKRDVEGVWLSKKNAPVFNRMNIYHRNILSYFIPRHFTTGHNAQIFDTVPIFGLYN